MRRWRNKNTGEIYEVFPAFKLLSGEIGLNGLEKFDNNISVVVPKEQNIEVVKLDSKRILKTEDRYKEERKIVN